MRKLSKDKDIKWTMSVVCAPCPTLWLTAGKGSSFTRDLYELSDDFNQLTVGLCTYKHNLVVIENLKKLSFESNVYGASTVHLVSSIVDETTFHK